ncbi:hypothetical protein HYX12_03395, partial [Candidatus Woesearchaeota archaeon]|nr:hypothetical protein [Candidatus Woesearchaeota archaeon]
MIAELIKWNLSLSATRNVSIFGATCVASGYCQHLEKHVGFSSPAVGFLQRRNLMYFLVDENYIAEKTEELLKQNKEKSIARLKLASLDLQNEFAEIIIKDKLFNRIVDFYPRYFGVLGFHNCFYRYLRLKKSSLITPEEVVELSKERDRFAEI